MLRIENLWPERKKTLVEYMLKSSGGCAKVKNEESLKMFKHWR